MCARLARKIPALEWLARKLEDAAHSTGLCPGWRCCAVDASPDSLPAAKANRPPICNRRVVSSHYRGHFRRALGPQSSSTTLTTVNVSSTASRYDAAALIVSGTTPNDSVVSDEPLTTIDEHTALRSRSQWV